MIRKRPTMNSGSQFRVQFGNGLRGINCSDPLTIDDGQASDGFNLWFQDGFLKNRPALAYQGKYEVPEDSTIKTYYGVPVTCSDEVLLYEDYDSATATTVTKRGYYVLFWEANTAVNTIIAIDTEGNCLFNAGTTAFFEGDFVLLESRGLMTGMEYGKTRTADKVLFIGGGNYMETAIQSNYQIAFQEITPYIPTVFINKLPDGTAIPGTDGQLVSFLEDYNVLSSRWKEQFTPDGKTSKYQVSQQKLSRKQQHIVTWYDYNEEDTNTEPYVFTIPTGSVSESYAVSNVVEIANNLKISVRLYWEAGIFEFRASATEEEGFMPYNPERHTLAINNITIETAKDSIDWYKPEIIEDCTMLKWFGGSSQGLSDGTSLFVSGNPDYPSRVFWSDTLNPYYFPESNYVEVGSNGEKVIALAKQYDTLVIMKEHSLYGMQYAYDSDFWGVQGQSTYVTYEINPNIGCISRGSVQLINNNLVWLAGDKKIYTLKSTGRANEKNVRKLSGNIEGLIGAIPYDYIYPVVKEHCLTASADWKGYYILFSGGKAWAWNYDKAPFVDSSDTDKAQRNLSWFYFTYTRPVFALKPNGEDLQAFSPLGCFKLGTEYASDVLEWNEETPVYTAFEKRWETKKITLDYPELKKLMSELWIAVSDETTARIQVTVMTERGQSKLVSPLYPNSRSDNTSKLFYFNPKIKGNRMIGLKIESTDAGLIEFAGAYARLQLMGR